MEMEKFPRIEVKVIDPEEPPTNGNVQIFFNGEDISTSTTGIEFRVFVGEMSRVTLHLYANVSIDGLVIHREGAE